jgi:hypothetical protein
MIDGVLEGLETFAIVGGNGRAKLKDSVVVIGVDSDRRGKNPLGAEACVEGQGSRRDLG